MKAEMTKVAHGLARRRDLRLRDLSPSLAAIAGTAAPMPGAVGPATCCSPRHRIPHAARNKGSKCVG